MYNLFSPLIKVYKELYLFAYGITGDYGFSLVVLSLFTFIVLYPFNKKTQQIQNREHKIQSVLSPQISEIKKQYSGREQYEQLQWLYQRYGYHPLYAIRSALGFVLQIPFLTAAYYMLSDLSEIRGVSWGFIPDLGSPDYLLGGINLLPFIMTLVTVVYAFVMPGIHKKEQLQTVLIGFFFLILLYSAPSALLIFWTCNLLWSLLDSVLGKKLEWIGEYISENELAFHIIFALSLTIGLLVPSDIYIKNAGQLWFSFADILKYFLADTAKYFTVFLLIYVLCWRKRTRVAYLSILLGLLFGVFLQSYIIGLDYGTFDGHEIEWGKYTRLGIANTVIWVACIGETFIRFYRQQFDSNTIKRFVKPVTFCIVAIQCLVLLTTFVKNPFRQNLVHNNGRTAVLTEEEMFTISAKNNIVVFLIDAFDASIFEEIQKKNPEELQALKDFTYYPDSISSYGFTDYSLPEILTGKLYDYRIQFPKYLEEAWKDNVYYKLLKDNNYKINIYTKGDYVALHAPVRNLKAEKIVIDDGVAQRFFQLTAFRIFPHHLKRLYYQHHSELQDIATFDTYTNSYKEDDRKFYTTLRKGLKLSENGNFYKFYHLRGVHVPYKLDENLNPIKKGKKGSAYKQALGSLKIVKEFISQMKKHDTYNNAEFVILADHGYHTKIGSRPVFLMKHASSNNTHMLVDNRPSMVAELLSFITANLNGHRNSITGAYGLKNDERFYYCPDEKKNGTGKFIKYLVKSPAKDIKSWCSLGVLNNNASVNREYKIGERIDFSYYGNAYNYKSYGWDDREWSGGTVITKSKAELVLHIDELEKLKNNGNGLMMTVLCNPVLRFFTSGEEPAIAYRTLKLYANDQKIGEWSFSTKDTYKLSVTIPPDVLRKEDLIVHFFVNNPPECNQPERFEIKEIRITKLNKKDM